jgi:hypothetical protein
LVSFLQIVISWGIVPLTKMLCDINKNRFVPNPFGHIVRHLVLDKRQQVSVVGFIEAERFMYQIKAIGAQMVQQRVYIIRCRGPLFADALTFKGGYIHIAALLMISSLFIELLSYGVLYKLSDSLQGGFISLLTDCIY